MTDDTVTLTIDDQSVTVPKNLNVVDAAKTAGIDIPIFCYHEKLGQLGCCRMCLVEIEKMPKLMTACTTQVQEGMVVKNHTEKVEKGRKGVLEFTLLNHPLDCPVCDKGGECPLQDNTFQYGPDDTRMDYYRFNNIKKTPLSDVITLDRERCIACQRCTQYSKVIEQSQGLVMLNRGFHNDVGTFNNEPYDSRFSGNIIDICPVGALTNTIFRFSARSWDLDNSKTLCANCGCNCNITFGTRQNELKRVTTRPNDHVDDGWVCDKGRWGHEFINSSNRIMEPGQKNGSDMDIVSLEDAIGSISKRLKAIVEEHGHKSIGFIGSPYGTNEELYLYQKLMRVGLGTNNIDHKSYTDSPGLPVAHYDFEDIETADLVILVGSDPTEELPILELRIKKAATRHQTKLAILNDQWTDLDKYAGLTLRYDVGSDAALLMMVANALAKELNVNGVLGVNQETGVSGDEVDNLVERILDSRKTCVVYNPAALTGNGVQVLKFLLTVIDQIPDVECGAMPSAPATNALGAMDMGVLPEFYPGGIPLSDEARIKEVWGESAPTSQGLPSLEMIRKAQEGSLKGLVVYRANPVIDFPGGKAIEEALKKLDFLVVHDMISTETTAMAHVVLPSNGPGYDEGTTTNIGGRVQYRRKGLQAKNIPDWKIISKLAQALGVEETYQDPFGITAEIATTVPGYQEIRRGSIQKVGKNRENILNYGVAVEAPTTADLNGNQGKLRLRVAYRLFSNDKVLEKDSALAHHFERSTVILAGTDAQKIGVQMGDKVLVFAGDAEVHAEVQVSNACNPGNILMPKVSDEQRVLSLVSHDRLVSTVQIKKV